MIKSLENLIVLDWIYIFSCRAARCNRKKRINVFKNLSGLDIWSLYYHFKTNYIKYADDNLNIQKNWNSWNFVQLVTQATSVCFGTKGELYFWKRDCISGTRQGLNCYPNVYNIPLKWVLFKLLKWAQWMHCTLLPPPRQSAICVGFWFRIVIQTVWNTLGYFI